MNTCFVIQPFDNGGVFDKRYDDVLVPAITEGGLKAYRVDRDPSANILIENIEDGIRDANICLADITKDNPNVWFELGFAFASKKDVILICSEERDTFPFDVQHRRIITYRIGSPSDFEKLRKAIVQRIKTLLTKERNIIELKSSIKETGDLSSPEIVVLVSLLENQSPQNDPIDTHIIVNDVEKTGFNKVACKLALIKLQNKKLISIGPASDWQGYHTGDGYYLTEIGINWLLENENRLNLEIPESPIETKDNIPF